MYLGKPLRPEDDQPELDVSFMMACLLSFSTKTQPIFMKPIIIYIILLYYEATKINSLFGITRGQIIIYAWFSIIIIPF